MSPFPLSLRLLVTALLVTTACLPAQDEGEGPITAKARTWTFVPFPESRCANGSATGLGVNLNADSREVLIYLQGGGACSSGEQCFGPVPGAANLTTGYGIDQFRAEANLSGIVFLDQLAQDNPFREANLVFVPYCTGDLHAGDAAATYDTPQGPRIAEHRGSHNLRQFLTRVTQTFPDAKRVWLVGASAGGFGALFNAHTVREAFAGVRVDVLSDSGPPFEVPAPLVQAWHERWRLKLPVDCVECAERPERILEHAVTAQPNARVGLLASERDAVLALYAEVHADDLSRRMTELRGRIDSLPRGRVEAFVVSGGGHVVIANRLARSDGVSLSQWLRQFATDDPAWRSAWP